MNKPGQSFVFDTDVDECLRLDVCREGRCINTVGAFRCEYCDSGYRMTRRGHCEGKCARETGRAACHRTGRCGVGPMRLGELRVTGSGDATWAQIRGWRAAALVLTVLLHSVGSPMRPRFLLTAQCLFSCLQPLPAFHGFVCLIFCLDSLIIFHAGFCLSWCLELRTQLIADSSGTRPDLITMSGCSHPSVNTVQV